MAGRVSAVGAPCPFPGILSSARRVRVYSPGFPGGGSCSPNRGLRPGGSVLSSRASSEVGVGQNVGRGMGPSENFPVGFINYSLTSGKTCFRIFARCKYTRLEECV